MNANLSAIFQSFQIYGSLLESAPYGNGHINDTLVAVFSQAGTRVRYIFQRINGRIFKDPEALMDNIVRVTAEARHQLIKAGVPDASRRVLRVIPTKDEKPFHKDEDGGYWRCYPFIEGARAYDIIENTRQAYEAARAFGEFQKRVAGLDGHHMLDAGAQIDACRAGCGAFRVNGFSLRFHCGEGNGFWTSLTQRV